MSAQPQRKSFNRMDDYVTVNERIQIFYNDFPQGRLITEIVELDRAAGFILMKAFVYRSFDDALPASSGHAYENQDNGQVNKSNFVENAETSAIGRALANLGYETKRSRDEVTGNQQAQQAHSNERLAASGRPDRPDTRTMGRIKELRTLLKVTEPLDFSKLTFESAEQELARLIEQGKKH